MTTHKLTAPTTDTELPTMPTEAQTGLKDREAHSDEDVLVHTERSRNPLGPVIVLKKLDGGLWSRLYATGIAVTATALLCVAAALSPNGNGLGTHRQLGLHECGFLLVTGFPCPTCGMTTAFSYTVRGQVIPAVRTQLAGFALAIATAVIGICAAIAAVTGRHPGINWYRVDPTRALWWAFALLLVSWATKIGLGLLDGSLPVKTH